MSADLTRWWKVRVAMPGSIIHLASSTEPRVQINPMTGRIADVALTSVPEGVDYGDTLGFIDWDAVVAVTWRESSPAAGRTP